MQPHENKTRSNPEDQQIEDERECPKCGTLIIATATTCFACGTEMEPDSENINEELHTESHEHEEQQVEPQELEQSQEVEQEEQPFDQPTEIPEQVNAPSQELREDQHMENHVQEEQTHEEQEEQPVAQPKEKSEQDNVPTQELQEEPQAESHEHEQPQKAEHEEQPIEQTTEIPEQDIAPPQELQEEPQAESHKHEQPQEVEHKEQLVDQTPEYPEQDNVPHQELQEEPQAESYKDEQQKQAQEEVQPVDQTPEMQEQTDEPSLEQVEEEHPVDQPSEMHEQSTEPTKVQETPQPPQHEEHTAQPPSEKENLASLEGIKWKKELLERIIETAPTIIIGVDIEGKITIFNDVAEMITGYKKKEALNIDFFSLLIPQEQWEETKAILEKSRQGIPLYNIEKTLLTKNNEEREILWSSAPIEDEEGGLIGEILIGNDITEKSIIINEVIRQNKELTAINSVGLSLSHSSDLNAILENALKRVLEIIYPAGGAIYLLDEREEKLVMRVCHGIDPKTSEIFGSFKRGQGILAKVLDASHHVLLKNLQLFSEKSQEVLKREGFEAMVFLPLRTKRGGIGVLAMGARDPKKLTTDNINVFTTITNQIGIIVDNIKLFNELSYVSKEWENTMNAIEDPMALVSNENKILWVNIAYARMMSKIPKDIIGKGCCDIFHDKKSPIHSCLHKKVFETKRGYSEEVYDQETGMTSQITCSPYTNAKGEIIGTLIITKDVTEKKEAENEIRYLKEFNENIVESLGDGVEIIGPEHKIQYMSNNFHKSVGKDVIGKTCFEVHFEKDKPCEGCPITSDLENMDTKTIECQTPDGKNILITHSPLKNHDGSYSAILLFKPQVNGEVMRTDSQVIPENTKPPEAPKLESIPNLNSIIHGIQHELNNPLGGIIGHAKALLEEDNPIKMRILAKQISDSAEWVEKLVASLSKRSEANPQTILEKIDLNEVIIKSLNTMNQYEKFANVEVQTDLKPIPKINGDPVDILNVFINLISNSLEIMQGQGTILISTRVQNGNVEMVFSDTVSNLTKEQREMLISPTFDLDEMDEGTSVTDNKMGLRMFTVSNILKKYNAPINVDSKEGTGTSFIVSFPHKVNKKDNN
jgi:PAS domain S-box-containing protein